MFMACIGNAVHITTTSTAYVFKTICVLELRFFIYSPLCVESNRVFARAHHWSLSKAKFI
jgi:hypothetical protein